MGSVEKGFIDRFKEIEVISGKMLTNAGNMYGDQRYDYLSQLQDAIIQFGEMIETHIDWLNDIASNEELQEHIKILLERNAEQFSAVVRCCEELCEIIYDMTRQPGAAYEKQIASFKDIEGKIAVILRYEILSDYDDEANNNGLERAVALLRETGIHTGDHYPVHILVNRLGRHYLPKYDMDDVAIILQGQIRYEEDFTLETLYRYRRLYPKIPIVVSTWKNEVQDDFRWRAQTIGVEIHENEYPEENGVFNINCQLVTSYEGIRYASEKYDIKSALKIRSDQRFYLPDFLQYFKNEIKLFPLKTRGRVEERIIFNGNGASVWSFPFRLADYWAFGTVNDMLALYSAPHSPEIGKDAYTKMWKYLLYDNEQIITDMSDEERLNIGREHKGLMDSEIYIAKTYYENHILGRRLDYDKDDVYTHYWRFVRDYTIIEDPQTLIMYWPKYKFRNYEYDCNSATGSLTHTSWLNLLLCGNEAGLDQERDN